MIKGDTYLSRTEKLAFLLGREQSVIERQEYINLLSDKFKVRVYGNEDWEKYIKCYCGVAEHFTVMPKVFRLSKINLNITRTFVESGLPMRIFDVLGSKGFLITNYKTGLEDCFNIGQDLLIYRDIQDIIDISEYYINHEEERLDIIKSGYENVKNNHSYEIRLSNIIKKVKEILS